MPRGRMLNKKISQDEKIAKLSLEATLLYTWCIPFLDVKGRIYGDMWTLKAIVPYIDEITPQKIGKIIQEWVKNELVVYYGNGEQKYIEFKGFAKNQTLKEGREAKSVIPDPSEHQEEMMVKEKQKPSKIKFEEDSMEYRLANHLYSFIAARNPNYKKPDMQKWAKQIDLMLRVDNRKASDIKMVIEWCQNDTPDKQPEGKWKGWANNILSAAKLREKFDTLLIRMNENKIRRTEKQYID